MSQFNDEDYYSGGPCPSCRLAINKETGRLKWCMGGNNTWRLRVRLMLIIPAVLLPITIIFIAICRSNTVGKISHQKPHPADDQSRENSNGIKATLNYDSDQSEIEDTRDLSQERRTSYVPPDNTFNMGRQKRDVSIGDRWHTFRTNGDVQDTLAERNTDNPEEKVENSLADYPDDEAEAYENGEIDPDDYPDGELMYGDTAGNSANQMPWHTVDSGDKDDGQPQGESDEGEQGGRPSINDDTWLAMDDGASDETSDFHAFWKGEGDPKSIREAQAKMMLRYMDKTVDPCHDFYQYACGNWGKRNPIPKDKAGYDTFEMLRESLDSVLKELLEEPISTGTKTNPIDATVKAKHLFQSCMNYDLGATYGAAFDRTFGRAWRLADSSAGLGPPKF